MSDKAEHPNRKLVSPEYKAKCLDWAVKVANIGEKPQNIVAAATAFYAYVYGDK